MLTTDPIDMPAASANSPTFTFESSNTSWIFSMISEVITSFGLPDRSAKFVLVRPHLNSPTHFLTI